METCRKKDELADEKFPHIYLGEHLNAKSLLICDSWSGYEAHAPLDESFPNEDVTLNI